MKYLAELEAAIKKDGGSELAAKVMPLVKPGVYLRKQFETVAVERPPLFGIFKRSSIQARRGLPVKSGASRVGGLPELPAGVTWPLYEGEPMQFLSQINCAELAEFREITLLPESGILYFFQAGFGKACQVNHAPAGIPLQPANVPPGGKTDGFVLPQFPVTFEAFPTMPDGESEVFKELGLDEVQMEVVLEANGAIVESIRKAEHSVHQIGGFPQCIQGEVFPGCERIASGQKISWEESEKSGHLWRLLLQFDTDDDLKVMWGDGGTLYFCIREEDLRAGRFDKVCMDEQCY